LHLPMQGEASLPTNMFHVINRCFQIMHARNEFSWRQHSDLVIEPDVRGMEWDAFGSALPLIKAGEQAALEALPRIRRWLETVPAAKDVKLPAVAPVLAGPLDERASA
jgi:hypothetical protein